MKVVILAGGYGTRLSEETHIKPKPMVEIGGKPILWHIMKIYSSFGFKDFVICLGYKGYYVKEYFHNYFMHMSDVTLDLRNNSMQVHQNASEDWKVTLIDTGQDTMTGGRIKRIEPYVNDETFLLTYGDGVGNIDINALIDTHKKSGKLATVTSVMPEGRFGALIMDKDSKVKKFQEKPAGDGFWINAGFFVIEPGVFKYLTGDSCIFEQEPLQQLASDSQLQAYRHDGFWKPMDTLRDKIKLEQMWNAEGGAPWKLWD